MHHRPLAAVIIVRLVLLAHQTSAHGGLSESIQVDWDPAGALSVRAAVQIRDTYELAVAGRSGDAGQRIRLGLEAPTAVAGPLAVSGAYRELLGSEGGPRSDAWYAPGQIRLDARLDSPRYGLAFRPLPAIEIFAWEAADLVVGTRLGLGSRNCFAEALGTLTSGASVRSGATTAAPSWFENGVPALPIGNLLVRLTGTTAALKVGSSVSVALPRFALPGISLRAGAEFSIHGPWTLSAIALLATTDYRQPGGERRDVPARWATALRREGRLVAAGIDLSRAYASPDLAYDRIGFAIETLRRSDAEVNASFTVRRRDEARPVAHVSGEARVLFSAPEPLSWRLRISSRVATPGGRLELTPSVSVGSGERTAARLRAVLGVDGLRPGRVGRQSTVDLIAVGEYERDPGGFDFDASFSVRTTVRRTDREEL